MKSIATHLFLISSLLILTTSVELILRPNRSTCSVLISSFDVPPLQYPANQGRCRLPPNLKQTLRLKVQDNPNKR